MFEKITNENVMLFALKHYDNPQCEGEKEFHDDMKRFKYIKRLLKKYTDHGVLKERLLLNHIIVLNNVFARGINDTYVVQDRTKVLPQLKSFMNFLGILPEKELPEVHEDLFVSGALRKL